MELLKQRILRDGTVKQGGILKVDSFLNHQIDIELMGEIGKEFRRLFGGSRVTKILTIEASGIGIACIAAQYFHVPVVFAKKAKSQNVDGEMFTSKVHSFTYDRSYDIMASKKFLHPDDSILIIDDFLAKGNAMLGLIDIVGQAGAELVGAGIVIEKGFQEGGRILRERGVNLRSLAIIARMSESEGVVFCDEDGVEDERPCVRENGLVFAPNP